MSRFEELCQLYATSRQEYLNYKHSCQDFADFLVHRLSLYLECPMETEVMRFDEDASLYVKTSLVLYANPEDRSHSPKDTIGIDLSVSKKGKDFEIMFLRFDANYSSSSLSDWRRICDRNASIPIGIDNSSQDERSNRDGWWHSSLSEIISLSGAEGHLQGLHLLILTD
jgi:hypothetical protein